MIGYDPAIGRRLDMNRRAIPIGAPLCGPEWHRRPSRWTPLDMARWIWRLSAFGLGGVKGVHRIGVIVAHDAGNAPGSFMASSSRAFSALTSLGIPLGLDLFRRGHPSSRRRHAGRGS